MRRTGHDYRKCFHFLLQSHNPCARNSKFLRQRNADSQKTDTHTHTITHTHPHTPSHTHTHTHTPAPTHQHTNTPSHPDPNKKKLQAFQFVFSIPVFIFFISSSFVTFFTNSLSSPIPNVNYLLFISVKCALGLLMKVTKFQV